MALSKETQTWLEDLKKEGGLSDELYTQLKSAVDVNSKVDELIKGSVLRQSDYSRVMSEVKAAQKAVEDSQTALATKEAAVTKYQGDLATWKDGADKNFQKALKDREEATAKAAAAVARLRSMAVANGLDENEVLKDIDTVVITKKDDVDNKIDTSKFLTREDATKVMAESALIDASIHDIAMDYFELTGQQLKNAAGLVQEAIKAGKSLTDYAAEKFKFGELRAKQTEAGVQKRIDDAVAAREAELASNGLIPGNLSLGRTGQRSPILDNLDKVSKIPGPEETGGGISAAVAAFQTGKYKR